jgi:hypothetical protein
MIRGSDSDCLDRAIQGVESREQNTHRKPMHRRVVAMGAQAEPRQAAF